MKKIMWLLLLLTFNLLAQPVIIGVDELTVKLNNDDSRLPLPVQKVYQKLDELTKEFTEKAEKRWEKCFKEKKTIPHLGSFYGLTVYGINAGNKKVPKPADCVECDKKQKIQESEESMACLMNHNKKSLRKILEMKEA